MLNHPWVSSLLAVALILLNAYVVFRAVSRSRSVEGTLAWVMAVLAFPGLGAIAYLALANPGIRRTTRRKRRTRASLRESLEEAAKEVALPRGQSSILHLAHQLTGLPPTPGNRVVLLSEDTDAFREIEQALTDARRYIWAEYYIICNDETGHRFLELLATKAAEGVQVRLLYDAVGSLGIDARRLAAVTAAGGVVEVFLPVNPLRRRWAVHLRNHRKMILVDGQVGFTGGMNIGDEYSGLSRRRGDQHFRDSHLAVYGPAVRDLAQIFAEDWLFANGERLRLSRASPRIEGASSVVAMVPSGPDQQYNASGLVYFAGIASAEQRVYLSSPYFLPDAPTTRALITAAMRGVDVRVLVPGKSDVALVGAAARSYYPRLVKAGVRVYEYQPSMLHAKTMAIDGTWGVVGSANIDIRSFRLNFEISALVVDAAFGRLLEERFRADLAKSRQIKRSDLDKISSLARLRDGAARLLSPLL